MAEDLTNISRALFGQGLGMGWGDEAEAWLRSKLGGQDYEKELSKIGQEYAKFAEERPVLAPALEFTGGAMPALAALAATPFTGGATAPAAAAAGSRLLAPALRGALLGGATGAVAGAGAAEPESRLSGAMQEGLGGAILGGAIPGVSRVGGELLDYGRGMLRKSPDVIERKAIQRIAQAAEDKGVSPQELLAKYGIEEASGRPGMLALQLPKLAETVAQRGGRGAEKMERELDAVREGGGKYKSQRQRLFDRTRQLSTKKFYTEQEDLLENLRQNARPAYEDAYSFGEITDPKIMTMLERNPDFSDAFKEAQLISKREAAAAELRGEDPGQYLLRPIYQTILQEGKEPIEKVTAVPTLRELDYIKRGMDAKIDALYRTNPAQAKSLKEVRNSFRDYLDKITEVNGESAYKKARNQYAGDMEMLDAIDLGKNKFNKMTKEELAAKYKGMTESEKAAFRTGVVQNMYDAIMIPKNNQNFATAFLTPDMQDKLKVLMPSEAHRKLFTAAMKREADLFMTTNNILKGSATAQRTEMKKAFEDRPEIAQAVAEAITSGPASIMKQAANVATRATMTDKIADRVADLLTSNKPEEVAAAVKLIEQYNQKAGQSLMRQGRGEAAAVMGTAAMQPKAPEEERPARDILKELQMESEALPERDVFKDIEEEEK